MLSVSGLPALLDDLDDFAAHVADTDAPDTEAAALLATAGKARARRRTGRMGDSITPAVGVVEVFAPYAAVVHQVFEPFMTDTVTATTGQVEDLYVDHVETALHDTIRSRY